MLGMPETCNLFHCCCCFTAGSPLPWWTSWGSPMKFLRDVLAMWRFVMMDMQPKAKNRLSQAVQICSKAYCSASTREVHDEQPPFKTLLGEQHTHAHCPGPVIQGKGLNCGSILEEQWKYMNTHADSKKCIRTHQKVLKDQTPQGCAHISSGIIIMHAPPTPRTADPRKAVNKCIAPA